MRTSSILAALPLAALFALHAACSSNDATTPSGDTPPAADASVGDDGGSTDDASDDGASTADSPAPDAGVDAGPFVEATHRGYPQIPGHGRTVLAPARVVSIFTPTEAFVPDLTNFGNDLTNSAWWKTVGADYGLSTITHVAVQSSQSLPSTTPTQNQLATYVDATIAAHPEIADDGHTIYLLYLPDGVIDSGNPSCQSHGGYHTMTSDGHVWALAIRCPTTGTSLSKLESLTVIASHEIIEAATDPYINDPAWTLGFLKSPSGSPWQSTEGEVGDMCVATQVNEGSWTYQRVWSNVAAAKGEDPCVPALTAPFYDVSADQDWYQVPAGGKVDVALHGWSTARMKKDWILLAQPSGTGQGTFSTTISSSTSFSANGQTFPTINNGGTATMTVQAPNASGAFTVIWVLSIEQPPAASSDTYHFWPVGVYTP